MNKNILNYLALNLNDTQHDYDTYAAGATDYINSVWHDKTEKPDHECDILIETTKQYFPDEGKVFSTHWYMDKKSNSDIFYWVDVIRWAYVADLLPEERKEKQ